MNREQREKINERKERERERENADEQQEEEDDDNTIRSMCRTRTIRVME